jgi:hypothetical protein
LEGIKEIKRFKKGEIELKTWNLNEPSPAKIIRKKGILHVRPKVVYTFCDFEKTPFFLIFNICLQNQHVT